ncbi:molybdenum cofactor biosynthesis protein MoaE [Campylobacter sp. MIT 21-1685]|uniref:molybdenum cofactor biosynthesis protein MoaE n=1 Tax=unclassified Campylobacter TaxID=2593542 RepID=UPI00224B334F|nr:MULTISPECIES: molybdenum cofactor biosynthesis protein MoaE [unclassified Campylobacter]MCX2683059.1 molybdenum cofactor biosynthesis protein MoaE [Campylobacter sp. MIT 21-1684]MCX2751341.1 molybdenum cofactor biosynthesis protein MoaE [Campylobacter sp. MIT 21-1682]MCX2807540.1 molybdenum cofactor biosynthesis protein MoaE [Campylobacter sp. MIT 21-1685]
MQNFILVDGALDVTQIYTIWYDIAQKKNCGALLTFCGIVRDEEGIEALSFDIYEPLLRQWFVRWEEKVAKQKASVFFAHSKGDVSIFQSSYMAGVLSKQRKLGLNLINEFVEDFKACAPIWKYFIKDKQRIYAKEQAKTLKGFGILS